MAEAALFSIATNILSTIASSQFKTAYERGQTIWGARKELDQLRQTIETVQCVLLDAEKKEATSAAIKNWIKRVGDVLYEADDLFDEVATRDLRTQQKKGNKIFKEVRVCFTELNPIIFNDSIAKRVKAIRKSLLQISEDMVQYGFVRSSAQETVSGIGRRVDTGSFVDPNEVFGRDEDMKTILSFVCGESNAEENISVIAIVGIGGMGKTTLAQLLYNDQVVEQFFEKTWWACISDVPNEVDVWGRIFHSVTGDSYEGKDLNQLETGVKKSVSESGKFLLVLDDLWDVNRTMGSKMRGILGSGAKGSKIIVTTRSQTVARAMSASYTHELAGLIEEMAWCLFKRIAFRPGQEEDPERERIGREVAKKCGNVPLAIASVGNIFYEKNSLREWEHLRDNDISQIDQSENGIMSVLRLSYDHLRPEVKHCFAYCSLFPKDYEFVKDDLVQLWMCQGYVHLNVSNGSQTLEDVGHMYFMELLRRSFFQEVVRCSKGEILSCKMHDLVHDLADLVSGQEIVRLSSQTDHVSGHVRHSLFEHGGYDPGLLSPLEDGGKLRSLLVLGWSNEPFVLDKRITKFRSLRVLNLGGLLTIKVSSCVGGLMHLRYLNLSDGKFEYLPNSMTKLLNLICLDITGCSELKSLPNDFRKLINLKCLLNSGCWSLSSFPIGFGEMTYLQSLSCFKVGGRKSSKLDALTTLESLKGELEIEFASDIDHNEDAIALEPLQKLEDLSIICYPGMTLGSLPRNLVAFNLQECGRIKHLPAFRCFPFLKKLDLARMPELISFEGEAMTSLQELEISVCSKLKKLSLPPTDLNALEILSIDDCPELELKGDGMRLASLTNLRQLKLRDLPEMENLPGEALTSLRKLEIYGCQGLKKVSLPPANLNALEILSIDRCGELKGEGVRWASLTNLRQLTLDELPQLENLPGEALTSLRKLVIYGCQGLKKLSLPSKDLNVLEELGIYQCPAFQAGSFAGNFFSNLRILVISACPGYESLSVEALTRLRELQIKHCDNLKKVQLPPPHLNLIKRLTIESCRKLELWDEKRRGVDWDSLPKLQLLSIEFMQKPEMLPLCLQQQEELGNLEIDFVYYTDLP